VKREDLLHALSLAFGMYAIAACASTGATATMAGGPAPTPDMSMTAPSPDRRVGLAPGWFSAAEASWNLRLASTTQPSAPFINRNDPGDSRMWNSDMAFTGHYVIQGNFSGYQIWDVSNPRQPTLYSSYVCPGTQSDVSVYHNLLFESSESLNGRNDCGSQGVADTVSKLITAYGSGDLECVRGQGGTFTGLAGMVTGGQVLSWRMAKLVAGADSSLRAGDVTVLWSLPGGAGQLRSSYRIQLVQRENRWLLQEITPAVGTS